MSEVIEYHTMRCSIPEGGEVVLYVPKKITQESLEMAKQIIEIQWRVFARSATRPEDTTHGE